MNRYFLQCLEKYAVHDWIICMDTERKTAIIQLLTITEHKLTFDSYCISGFLIVCTVMISCNLFATARHVLYLISDPTAA